MEYLFNDRSYGGPEGSSGIVDGMPFLGYIFWPITKNSQNKQTYFKIILQALLLVTKQAEPIKGLLKGSHSFVLRYPFLHSPVPIMDHFGPFWTILDHIGQFLIILDHF